MLCLKLLPLSTSNLNEICYTCMMPMMCRCICLPKWFQRNGPGSKFLYILITCDKAVIGDILVTISDRSSLKQYHNVFNRVFCVQYFIPQCVQHVFFLFSILYHNVFRNNDRDLYMCSNVWINEWNNEMYLIINRVFIDSYTDGVLSSTLLYVHIKDLVLFFCTFHNACSTFLQLFLVRSNSELLKYC